MNKMSKRMDLKNYDNSWPSIERTAVRGIISNKGKYALVYCREYNEYKIPGGGMEQGEAQEDTLIREVLEETGLHIIPSTIEYFCEVVEKRKDKYLENTIFEHRSVYYSCEVDLNHISAQNLDEYEQQMGFQLEWISAEEAIHRMEEVEETTGRSISSRPWILRDYYVLQLLAGKNPKDFI